MPENVWLGVLLAGAGGIGLGLGLVAAAFLVRIVRRYMRDDDDG